MKICIHIQMQSVGDSGPIPVIEKTVPDADAFTSETLDEATALRILNHVIDEMNFRLGEVETRALGAYLKRPFPWIQFCRHCSRYMDSRTLAEHSQLH